MLKTVSTQLALASDTLSEILANGNTSGGTDLAISTGDDITLADNSKVIFGAGSDLSISSDGATGQLTGNINVTGAGTFTSTVASAGVYLGGVVAANLLDDYEEGTWNPTHSGMNATGTVTVSGTYTKVGRKAFITAKISATGGLAPVYNGGSRFQSLPFTGGTCVANWCVENAVTAAASTFSDGSSNIYAPTVSVGAGVTLTMNMTLEV
jgi:hypothetical protein